LHSGFSEDLFVCFFVHPVVLFMGPVDTVFSHVSVETVETSLISWQGSSVFNSASPCCWIPETACSCFSSSFLMLIPYYFVVFESVTLNPSKVVVIFPYTQPLMALDGLQSLCLLIPRSMHTPWISFFCFHRTNRHMDDLCEPPFAYPSNELNSRL